LKPAMSDYNSDEEASKAPLLDEKGMEDEEDAEEGDDLPTIIQAQISLDKADIIQRLQQRLNMALEKLPPLDTSDFWALLENPTAISKMVIPEVLAWTVRQFAEQGNQEKVNRAFKALCLQTKKMAHYLASSSIYLSSEYIPSSERMEYAKDIVQEALLQLYKKLTTSNHESFELNFKHTFELIIKSEAKSLARKEGYYQNKRSKAEAAEDENIISSGKVKRIPRQFQVSFDAPISTSSQGDETDNLILAEVVPDAQSSYEIQGIENVEFREAILARLKPDEAQIFRLRYADDLNLNEIAAILGHEWKWVNRRYLSTQKVATEIMALSPEEVADLQNSLKKKAKPREGTGK